MSRQPFTDKMVLSAIKRIEAGQRILDASPDPFPGGVPTWTRILCGYGKIDMMVQVEYDDDDAIHCSKQLEAEMGLFRE